MGRDYQHGAASYLNVSQAENSGTDIEEAVTDVTYQDEVVWYDRVRVYRQAKVDICWVVVVGLGL